MDYEQVLILEQTEMWVLEYPSLTRIFRIPREWHSFTIRGRVRLTLLNLIELRLVWGIDRTERLPAAEWFAESFCAIYCHVCFVFWRQPGLWCATGLANCLPSKFIYTYTISYLHCNVDPDKQVAIELVTTENIHFNWNLNSDRNSAARWPERPTKPLPGLGTITGWWFGTWLLFSHIEGEIYWES